MRRHTRDPIRITRRAALVRGAGTLAAVGAGPWLEGCSEEQGAPAADGGRDAGSPEPPAVRLPARVAGIAIPDSPLARAAAAFAFEASPEQLYNHCIRTYVFAALLFDKLGRPFDAELAFVGSALHDLGLVEKFWSPTERFEVDGADAALAFLREQGMSDERAAIVWDAIALHGLQSIALRKAPEIALVSIGAALDATGRDLDQLPPERIEEVLEAYPRLGFKQAALATMIRLCEQKPLGQLLHPFAEVGRKHLPGFVCPTVDELILGAPFAE